MRPIKMNENDQQIYQYMVEHIDEISSLTCRELGRRTYNHPTTVLRLVRKLGYENYNDFKCHFALDLKHQKVNDFTVSENESDVDLMSQFAKLNTSIIEKLQEESDLNYLKNIVSEMNKCICFDFIATELNAELSECAAHLFRTEGKLCHVYSGKTEQLVFAQSVNQEHIVFLISKNGKNRQILEIAKLLRNSGIITIAVSNDKESMLSKICTFHLECIYNEKLENLGLISYIISFQFIFNYLYSRLLSTNYSQLKNLNDQYLSNFYNH